MKVHCRLFAILAGSCLLAVSALGEAVPAAAGKTAVEEKGFTLTETYEGSGNTDGFITDIDSTVGYIFNPHFSINMGVQYLFVNHHLHIPQRRARLPRPAWGTHR